MTETLDINKFDPTVAELNLLVESYSTLSIKGIDDEEGYAAVKEAQGVLAKQRNMLTKTGKAMRDDALKFQRAVIAKEKELTGIIEPLELSFKQQIADIDKLREAERRRGMLPARRAKADDLMLEITDEQLLSMDETQFINYIQEEQRKNIEAANARIAQEQADLKAREDVIKAKELEAQRLVELEAAKEAARLQGIKEAEEKAARDKEEAKRKAQEEEDLAQRVEQLKATQERVRQQMIEENAVYKSRLTDNGCADPESDDWKVVTNGTTKTLYKKVAVYQIPAEHTPMTYVPAQETRQVAPHAGYDPAIGF